MVVALSPNHSIVIGVFFFFLSPKKFFAIFSPIFLEQVGFLQISFAIYLLLLVVVVVLRGGVEDTRLEAKAKTTNKSEAKATNKSEAKAKGLEVESKTQCSRPRTQKKNPRQGPRTDLRRTDPLEAKDQGQAQVFSKKNFFFRRSPKIK